MTIPVTVENHSEIKLKQPFLNLLMHNSLEWKCLDTIKQMIHKSAVDQILLDTLLFWSCRCLFFSPKRFFFFRLRYFGVILMD